MIDPTASGVHRLELDLVREKRLTEASTALHTTLDLDELLEMILTAACDGTGSDRGTVFLVSEDGTELWSRVLKGDESLEIRLPMGQGIAGAVAKGGAPERIADAYEDARFDRSWDESSGYRTRQILCRPIRNRDGQVTGVFQLLNKASGDFDGSDEVYLDALGIHAALALENAQLHLSAIEQERTQRQILLVQDVQRAYQPERASVAFGPFRGAGMNLLCEDASGDYYDFIELESGRYAVVIGDVSGHGLRSALIMAQARAFLRAFCATVETLAEVVHRLDVCLAEDLSAGLFMCLSIAIVDPQTGGMIWVNAGHPPPFLRRARDGSIVPLDPTGGLLGIFPDAGHEEGTPLTMEPGDVLLMYTDGATEARHPDGTMFEDERLQALLGERHADDPADLLEYIHDTLCAWTGAEQMDDDFTILALKMGPL